MRQKELEKWLKIVIIAVALCGLVVCAVAIPWIGHVLIAPDPQISDFLGECKTYKAGIENNSV